MRRRRTLITSPLKWQMTALPVSHPALPVVAERGGTQLRTPKPVIVVDTRTEEGMKKWYGPDYAAGCIYAKREFIDKNPNTAQAVVNAMVRALRFVKTASADKILEVVPPEYYAGDKETWKAALQKAIPGFSSDGRFSQEGAESVYKVLKLFEPSVMNAKIDLAKTFDNRFVDKAANK